MNSFVSLTRANVLASEIEQQILDREFKPGELIAEGALWLRPVDCRRSHSASG